MPSFIVKIKTVDETYAGTDSRVAVQLHKGNASSEPQYIDRDGYNDFTPGSITNYAVDTDLPEDPVITSVTLYCNGYDQWKPAWAMVFDPLTDIVWMADFASVVLHKNNISESRTAKVYRMDVDEAGFGGDGVYPAELGFPASGAPTPEDPSNWNQFLQWSSSSADGLHQMVVNAGGKSDLIAIGLVQLLERTGLFADKFNYVTVGGMATLSAIVSSAVEIGTRHRIDRTPTNISIGPSLGAYHTIDFGLETGVGFDGAITAAAWTPQDETVLGGYAFCRSLALQGFGGIEISWLWGGVQSWGQASGFGAFIGVEIAISAGLAFELGAGVSWPYTVLW